MLHERYYIEKEKQEKLLARKNEKSDFYNGVFDRYSISSHERTYSADLAVRFKPLTPIRTLWSVSASTP